MYLLSLVSYIQLQPLSKVSEANNGRQLLYTSRIYIAGKWLH